jgi:hypothetical protein
MVEMVDALLVGIAVAASVFAEGCIAFLVASFFKRHVGGFGYLHSAFVFLLFYWLLLLETHALLIYLDDRHLSHGHEHAGLHFATTTYENLQSEDWQIMLAAFTFSVGAIGAKFFWRGAQESQE